MSELRTYYGPWLETIPTDAPDGSIWDAVYVFQDGDTIECQIVAFKGCLIDEDAITVDRDDLEKARRVWPPGSVLPEPRPLVVDGKVRNLFEADHWMISTKDGDRHQWETSSITDDWVEENSGEKADEHFLAALCYPVDPLPNGAFVPRPWPDQLGEEQP